MVYVGALCVGGPFGWVFPHSGRGGAVLGEFWLAFPHLQEQFGEQFGIFPYLGGQFGG